MHYKAHYPYITLIIDQSLTIDELFHQLYLSKKTIHLLKQNKDYKVNKEYVSSSTLLNKGDQITIKAYQKDDGMYLPIYDDLDIVYEDDILLVVNKPPFINVYPDEKAKLDSLSHLVSGYYHMQGYDIPVRYIHRLDYETSGLVIYCKCALFQPLLDRQLATKHIHRYYQAIALGRICEGKHKIEKMIAKDRHHNQRMRIAKSGQYALTYYQAISINNQLSLIECQLETGRKHQIRVHMASIGHPLLGDHLYHKPSALINRQALHAYKITLLHPITKESLTITCPLPKDMLNIIKSKSL